MCPYYTHILWSMYLCDNLYMQVYRHPYQQKFHLDFTISLGEGHEEVVTDPISLMEVNGRTSFKITGQARNCHSPHVQCCFCAIY